MQDAKFQPTLPARGATSIRDGLFVLRCISTHAPRTGSDIDIDAEEKRVSNFNPRSPHGERPAMIAMLKPKKTFQPTLPARGATSFHSSPTLHR